MNTRHDNSNAVRLLAAPLLSMTDPAGNVQRQSFDGLGNITSTTDGLGRTATNTYDGASRLTARDSRAVHRRVVSGTR